MVPERDRLAADLIAIPHGRIEQDTHKAVSIETIRAIVRSMVKEF